MIGSINPNPYIHWLNKKILPDVYSEPSQTSEMKLFVKVRSRHSELFSKIGITKEEAHSLKDTCEGVYLLVKVKAISLQNY